jgi:hypothetical protein
MLITRCRQDYTLLCCDLRSERRLKPYRRGVFLVIIGLLFWLAHLGHSLQPHHAKMSTRLVLQLQHLHVSHSSHGRKEEEKKTDSQVGSTPHASSSSNPIGGLRGNRRPCADVVHFDVLHSSGTTFENLMLVCFQRSRCSWRWIDR